VTDPRFYIQKSGTTGMLTNISEIHPLNARIRENRLSSNVIFGLIYGIFCFFGFWLSSKNGELTPIWPASGLAVAAVFIGGRSLLPGLFIASLLSNAFTGMGMAASFCVAMGSLLEAYVAFTLLQSARKVSELLGDYTLPAWIIVSSFIAPIIAAYLGIFGQAYLSTYAIDSWPSDLLRVWWLSSSIGILVVTPAMGNIVKTVSNTLCHIYCFLSS